MEVLGAVASTLTLLEVSLKTAGFLKGLSEAQSDFESLQEQIVDIHVLVQDFGKLPRLFANTPGLPQISDIASLARASKQLQEVQQELGDIVAHCAQILDDDSARVQKRKWVSQRSRIQKLLDKTRNVKGNLQLAIQMQTYTIAAEQMIFRDRLRSDFAVALESLRIVRDSPPSRMSISEEGETSVDSHQESFEETTLTGYAATETEAACNASSDEIDHDGRRMIQSTYAASNSVQLIESESEIESDRPQECLCSRRLRRNHYRTPTWLQPLFGSLRVECATYPGALTSTSLYICKCDKEHTLSLDFQFPMWLSARVLLFEAAFGSSGLRCALRPARLIPNSDEIWSWFNLKKSDLNTNNPVRKLLLTYSPSDENVNGTGLAEYFIMNQSYDMLEILLDLWENILNKQKLPRASGYAAYHFLEQVNEIDDRERYLLDRVIAFVDDMPEWKSTMVHHAAFTGEDMSSALEVECWAKNEFDWTGKSPIHIASRHGNYVALEELLRVGVDVNQQAYNGLTPLMLAAANGHVECLQLLLQVGCDLNQKDCFGKQAIHFALRDCHLEAITLLLTAGASLSAIDQYGWTPLHYLAVGGRRIPNLLEVDDAFCSKVCQVVDLLLATKDENLNALDKIGITPALRALRYNNVPLLRVLIEAGATLHGLYWSSANFLHIAAGWVIHEELKYLLTVPPELFYNTNVDLRDNNGCTPWGVFQWTMRASTWNLLDARCPSPAEKVAFTRLFKLVRDTNLRLEIDALNSTIEHLRAGSVDDARVQLSALADQKASPEWKEYDLAGWYRGIIQQTRADQIEDAIAALVEYVNELTAKIGTEP